MSGPVPRDVIQAQLEATQELADRIYHFWTATDGEPLGWDEWLALMPPLLEEQRRQIAEADRVWAQFQPEGALDQITLARWVDEQERLAEVAD